METRIEKQPMNKEFRCFNIRVKMFVLSQQTVYKQDMFHTGKKKNNIFCIRHLSTSWLV